MMVWFLFIKPILHELKGKIHGLKEKVADVSLHEIESAKRMRPDMKRAEKIYDLCQRQQEHIGGIRMEWIKAKMYLDEVLTSMPDIAERKEKNDKETRPPYSRHFEEINTEITEEK